MTGRQRRRGEPYDVGYGKADIDVMRRNVRF